MKYNINTVIMTGILSALLSLVLLLLAAPPAAPRLVELSYTYNKDAPTSPKLRPFNMTVLKNGINELGIWVVLNEFCTSEHSGTHVDAPIHFARDTWALDEIPLEHMWRVPGVLIDVSQAAAASKERNYAIPVEELEAWENRYGVIPDFSVVLLRTGWGAKSHDIADYSGLDAERKNNFPGLSEEAATWLATHGSRHGHVTGVVGVGIDTISVDVGNSTHYKAHHALYSRNLYGMENMNNLDKLPPHNFLVTVMPMRIGGGSGAPARIVAEMSDEPVGMPMHRQHVDSAAMGLHAQAPLLLVGVGLLLIPRRAH